LDSDVIKEMISFFAESNCLKATYEPFKKKRVRLVSAFEIDVTLIENSKAILRKIQRAIRPVLKSPFLWITLGFIALNSIAFSGKFASIFADSRNFEMLGSTVVGFFFYFFIVLAPVIVIHELAHAVALVHYGGTPGDIGTGLFYFGPMFYVDATDAWMLPRRQRIMVMMAGNISTLAIASIIVTWNFLSPFPSSIAHIMNMAAFFCFYSTLMNLAPPFETDGYYVLMDMLNMPRLREDSYSYLKTTVKKTLRRPVEKVKGLTRRKKGILLGYAVLSGVWIVYTAYQTMLFTFYMAEDVGVSFLNISSAVLAAQTLSVVAIIISVASILYFAMTVTGYGVILLVAVKNAVQKTLNVESIHDRDVSVCLYLPPQVPKPVANDLDRSIKKVAMKLTPNYTVRNVGPLHAATLRMGGTQLAMVQIREHLRETEATFYSMYKKFLLEHSPEIFASVGIYSPDKSVLTTLLNDMANTIAASGMPEAKKAVTQIIGRENKATLYLLNSAFGTVWTVELPPIQQLEVLDSLRQTFLVEDLAVTDLYDEVEEFKKSIVYGFDSLAQLSAESQKSLDQALAETEKHQLVSFFEPVKSRLVFVGRTEKIERDIAAFGSLFVCQVWCGYLDNLLSEINLTLAALGKVPTVEKDEVQALKDGELLVLHKSLSTFAASEDLVTSSLKESEKCLHRSRENIQTLKEHFSSDKGFPKGLVNCVLAINNENMNRLPQRLATFRVEFQRLSNEVRKTMRMTKTENNKREDRIAKKKRKLWLTSLPVLVVSAILALAAFPLNLEVRSVSFVAAVMLLNAVYWPIFSFKRKSYSTISKYPSPAFSRVQLFLLALTQAVHKFVSTSDVIEPTVDASFETRERSKRN